VNEGATVAAKKQRILIVEDEVTLNEAYQLILEQQGYDVMVAFNGEEALQATKNVEPDLILLDLRMPVMDGVEFLRAYDAPREHPKVKIVIFSNYDMQKEIDEAYKLGAARYILKAWASPKELLQVVEHTLA
jgi:two-component system response regulator VicR